MAFAGVSETINLARVWIVLVEDYRGAIHGDKVLESLIRRVPECPSALCFETLGRARRGKVAVGSSVYGDALVFAPGSCSFAFEQPHGVLMFR